MVLDKWYWTYVILTCLEEQNEYPIHSRVWNNLLRQLLCQSWDRNLMGIQHAPLYTGAGSTRPCNLAAGDGWPTPLPFSPHVLRRGQAITPAPPTEAVGHPPTGLVGTQQTVKLQGFAAETKSEHTPRWKPFPCPCRKTRPQTHKGKQSPSWTKSAQVVTIRLFDFAEVLRADEGNEKGWEMQDKFTWRLLAMIGTELLAGAWWNPHMALFH